jgi:hypothetical protein
VCDGVVCNTPPADDCASAIELTTYAAEGSCVDGICVYEDESVSCACKNDACVVDACAGIACETPPASVCTDASTQTSYAASGTCSADGCSYAATDTACPFGCAAGQCQPDPCAGKVCNTPPPDDCSSGTQFKSYDKVGSCSNGACTYTSHLVACTCQNHACTTDPCEKVTCNAPPASVCKDGDTVTKFAASGTCEEGSCSYTPTNSDCLFGCASGACKSDPCSGVSCKSPPAATCKDAMTRTTFASTGTCGAGKCSYKETDTPCPFGCVDGSCQPDPCAGVTCSPLPATCKDESTRLTTPSSGVCKVGDCTYTQIEEDCPFGCANGACQACDGKVCNGKCIKGCCTASDCPLRQNSTRSCNANHECESTCKSADYANCNGDLQDGCEVDLRDGQRQGQFVVENCGACGVTCQFDNYTTCDETQYNRCDSGQCWVQWAEPLFASCPQIIPHGEIKSHDCSEEGCYYRCESGWKDCDFQRSNGCETQAGQEPPDTTCSTDWIYFFQ